jgi:hypothetical protein
LSLARKAGVFLRQGSVLEDDLGSHAAILIAELLLNCPWDADQRNFLARKVFLNVEPLPFAPVLYEEVFRPIREALPLSRPDSTPEYRHDESLLPETAVSDLRAVITRRISELAQRCPPYEEFTRTDALALLRFWWVDRPEEVKNYLRARVQCHAKEAVDILNLFPQATVLGFESLTKMIDIEVLAAALEKHCGVALANREWSNELFDRLCFSRSCVCYPAPN